jgi:hypothetical protein
MGKGRASEPFFLRADVYDGPTDAVCARTADLGFPNAPFEFALLDASSLFCDFFGMLRQAFVDEAAPIPSDLKALPRQVRCPDDAAVTVNQP